MVSVASKTLIGPLFTININGRVTILIKSKLNLKLIMQ